MHILRCAEKEEKPEDRIIEAAKMVEKHVLLVTFPALGHINPSLQFAKRLANHGVHVTFLTSKSNARAISQAAAASSSPSQSDCLIEFAYFSNGYDNGWSNDDAQNFMAALRDHGSKAVEAAITARREEGRPFARVIYNLLVPWAGQVAHRLRVPVTLLWIQPAIVFGVYFYYFNKYFEVEKCDNGVVKLPGLPEMEITDLPSFFQPSNPNIYDFAIPTFTENFQILDREDHPTVLVNTFDALEDEALRVLNKYRLMAIGPLIPPEFLEENTPSDPTTEKPADHYVHWLDSKEKSSVMYVAFGSYSELSKPQMEEIARGLIQTGMPFLWVIRSIDQLDEIVSCRDELEKQGKIVAWCTQVEVLSHPSVGCFLTHCGWNSTLESLVSGVPLVMFPQWSDQGTNAKLVQDHWKSGVRLLRGDDDENGGIVKSDEIQRCLEKVMMNGEEMRREVKKWRELAKEASKEDGTSNLNLNIFVHQLLATNQ